MNKKIFTIALDGPGGAGKSEISKVIAEKLGMIYLDTGAMYRALGLYMINIGVDTKDEKAVCAHVDDAVIEVRYIDGKQKTHLMGVDVEARIRDEDVGKAASEVSAYAYVRKGLVKRQREIAAGVPVIMDGRDIGTCVLPDATLKVYLTADASVRAMRRYKQIKEKNPNAPDTYESVYQKLVERDHNDSTRENSPLTVAEDAVVVDTTSMTMEEAIQKIIDLLNEKLEAQA